MTDRLLTSDLEADEWDEPCPDCGYFVCACDDDECPECGRLNCTCEMEGEPW